MTLRPEHSDSSIPAVPVTPKALHSLIASIPAKTLHAYLLDNISAAPPDTLAALASFFAALTPPPLLHCVRCHEDYIDVENGDHSCCVPHDEESIDVDWVGGHGDSEYETLYFCCSKRVQGEGDRGPPAGWCYEGMHTTDAKRARFRADSTKADNKLDSCLWLNCRNVRTRSSKAKKNAGAGASTSGRAKRARPPADEDGGFEGTEDSDIVEIVRDVDTLSPKTKSKGKSKSKARATKTQGGNATPARGGQGQPRSRSHATVHVQVRRTRAIHQRQRTDAEPRSAASSPAGDEKTARGTTEGKVRKRRKVAHTATA
ncbi:hypothetical protein V8E52_000127 [Russula decolorans]